MTIRRSLLPVAFLLATSACVDTAVPHYRSSVDYQAQKAYALDVNDVALLNDSQPNPLTQEFAGKFGTTLETSLNEWLQHRILVSGPQGTLTVVIRNANFEASKLPIQSGVKGYFTREQAARWSGNLDASLSVKGSAQKQPYAEIQITVSANRTVPEKASDEEKSKIYHSLVNELLNRFDQEADAQIRNHFSAYLL